MTNINNDLDTQPWYKQGWPWALIAIPLLTVIAGVITFIIAANTSDSLVTDDYYKEGKAINSNIEKLIHAKDLGVIANISFEQQANLLSLSLTSNTSLPKTLELFLSHPTQKTKDISIVLSNLTGGDYVANLEDLEAAFWHITVEDENKTWELKGRWLYPDRKNILLDNSAY